MTVLDKISKTIPGTRGTKQGATSSAATLSLLLARALGSFAAYLFLSHTFKYKFLTLVLILILVELTTCSFCE